MLSTSTHNRQPIYLGGGFCVGIWNIEYINDVSLVLRSSQVKLLLSIKLGLPLNPNAGEYLALRINQVLMRILGKCASELTPSRLISIGFIQTILDCIFIPYIATLSNSKLGTMLAVVITSTIQYLLNTKYIRVKVGLLLAN